MASGRRRPGSPATRVAERRIAGADRGRPAPFGCPAYADSRGGSKPSDANALGRTTITGAFAWRRT